MKAQRVMSETKSFILNNPLQHELVKVCDWSLVFVPSVFSVLYTFCQTSVKFVQDTLQLAVRAVQSIVKKATTVDKKFSELFNQDVHVEEVSCSSKGGNKECGSDMFNRMETLQRLQRFSSLSSNLRSLSARCLLL